MYYIYGLPRAATDAQEVQLTTGAQEVQFPTGAGPYMNPEVSHTQYNIINFPSGWSFACFWVLWARKPAKNFFEPCSIFDTCWSSMRKTSILAHDIWPTIIYGATHVFLTVHWFFVDLQHYVAT